MAETTPLRDITDLQFLNRSEEQNLLGQIQNSLNRLSQYSAVQGAGGNVSGGGGNVSGGGNQRLLFEGSADDIQKIKTYQISQLGLTSLHDQGFTGKKFRIVLIDSGLNPQSPAASHVHHFADFTGECTKKTLCDGSGHGSQIADLVLQSAPDASLIVLKTLGRDTRGEFKYLANALKWVLSNHEKMNIKVVNLSLLTPHEVSGVWNEVDEARILIQKLSEKGVLLIAAVGNEYRRKNISQFPATAVQAIAVGSYSHQFSHDPSQRQLSAFSNFGFADQPPTKHSQFLWSSNTERNFIRWSFKPEVLAIGENILTCLEKCEFVSGTSFAAAFVSGGILSQLDKDPNLTRESFLNQQARSCEGPRLTNDFDRFMTCSVQFKL